MTGSALDSVEPYYNLSAKAYEHPADRAATAALKAVPGLDTLVRRLIEWRYERALRQFYWEPRSGSLISSARSCGSLTLPPAGFSISPVSATCT